MTQNDTLTNLNIDPTDTIDLPGVDHAALASLNLDTMSVDNLADWLYDHGAAHLSAIERIELAERLTRRRFLIGAGGLLGATTLGACSVGREESRSEDTDQSIASDVIRLEHAAGITEVPRDVGRIAALDGNVDIHALIALDVVPQIAPKSLLDGSTLVGDKLDQIEIDIPRGNQMNLEALVAANPDLIFGVEYNKELYDELSAIAPTVLLDRNESSVDEHLRTVAKALDRSQTAEQVISDYESRLEAVQRLVEGSRLTEMPFAVVSEFSIEGFLYVIGKDSFAAQILQNVGVGGIIDPKVSEELGGPFGLPLSMELLPQVLGPAEFIVMLTFPFPVEGEKPIADNPLWNELSAVQNGAVVERSLERWFIATAISRMAILDDIEDLVERFG